MSQVKGFRLGKRDRQNQIRAILPKGTEVQVNGVTVKLNAATAVVAKSHEDINEMLNPEKSEEALDNSEEQDIILMSPNLKGINMRQDTEYLYVITRRDLPLSSQAVQAGHAAFQAASELRFNTHPHFVYLTEKNLSRLSSAIRNLTNKNLNMIIWREPDLHNEITAVAIGPVVSKEDRKLFKKFQLMKGDKNE